VDPVLDHFFNPRNVGEIEDPHGVGTVGDPGCGDFFKVWIRIGDERLCEVKYKVQGCPAAIACCSMMSEMVSGMTLEDAYQVDDVDIVRALGGLPAAKEHCSAHAATALRNAIDDFVFRPVSKHERGRVSADG
jgi:nitrogen fixation protein NifU and related proteins